MEKIIDNPNLIVETDKEPQKCENDCGFYGHLTTGNLCSKCHSITKKRKEVDVEDAVEPSLKHHKGENMKTSSIQIELPQVPNSISSIEKKDNMSLQTKPRSSIQFPRCQKCNIKVSLTAFACRCGLKFCNKHQYSDQHGCTFNYKAEAKKELLGKNPQVISSKLNKL